MIPSEEQITKIVTNSIYDALVKFQDHQMQNFSTILDKGLQALPQVMETVEDMIEEHEEKRIEKKNNSSEERTTENQSTPMPSEKDIEEMANYYSKDQTTEY